MARFQEPSTRVFARSITQKTRGRRSSLLRCHLARNTLNVIESVFSGMRRAIIHNSDFPSPEAAQGMIDKYFAGRNEEFSKRPKRAGQKIWGDERVPSEFSVSHNCKDPKYR